MSHFNLATFDVNGFQKKFDNQINILKHNERVTKSLLGEMSRYVLQQLHTNEDVRPVNAIIRVLTPMNKATAIEFFRTMSGFGYDKDNQVFTKKNHKGYDEARKLAAEFLDDDKATIWTWAAENVTVQRKDFTLEQVRKSMEGYIKKAQKANYSTVDVLRAVMGAGFTAGDMATLMQELAQAEAPEQAVLA